MKNNKKIMLSLAMVAVIAVAAVGIGFAYTATTSNTGNTAGVEYYKIGVNTGAGAISTTSDDYIGSFTSGITYDTMNTGGTITYTIDGTPMTNISGKTVCTPDSVTIHATRRSCASHGSGSSES